MTREQMITAVKLSASLDDIEKTIGELRSLFIHPVANAGISINGENRDFLNRIICAVETAKSKIETEIQEL